LVQYIQDGVIKLIKDTITSTTLCTDCGEKIQSDWKFCPHCTEKQKKGKCVHCRKEISAHWNFCPFCQKSLKAKTYIGTGQRGDEWIRKLLKNS
jgi:predicted amidophosphoribosyltransferase